VPPTSSRHPLDYEPVVPLGAGLGGRGVEDGEDEREALRPSREAAWGEDGAAVDETAAVPAPRPATVLKAGAKVRKPVGRKAAKAPVVTAAAPLRPGHAFTFAGLLLFTFYLFYRPYEFLPLPANLAFWFALLTLLVYIPSQLSVEGTLTARPREVNLVLLLCLTGLLSIPLAKGSAGEAWGTFSDIFIRAILVFVIIVNAVRTEGRLRWMLRLSVGSAVVLAVWAFNDFRAGRLTVEGYRVAGRVGGIFENPNDMALHLVTMLPIAIALAFGSRGLLKRLVYGAAAAAMVAGTVVTYSRGGFLAMSAAMFVLAWTLGRKQRFAVVVVVCVFATGLLVLAPGGYGARIFSIYNHKLDALGSADARQALLLRSILVALRNPLFGVGMGNFSYVSFNNAQSHNAYTQVAAEMGAAAFACYVLFILSPLRRLFAVARETFDERRTSRFYYLAVGLAASLVGYMVSSFFASVAYYWNVYYLVGYAVCLRRLYEAERAKAAAANPKPAGAEGAAAAGKVEDEEGRDGLSESARLNGRASSL
jgi:putative inorganic carbon (hco3(-)) transporter